MDKKKLTAKERLTRLRELISYYRDLYYAKDASEISDQAYDALVAELVSLEEKLEGERSDLTESVGTLPSVAFAKVTHKVPQWSFDNVFSFAELQAWEDRLIRYLEKEGIDKVRPTYVTEHKIDGLKIVLEYKKGVLYQALTRGDGEVGEDVTHTAKTIKSLPLKLQYPVNLICVGEVWLGKEDFAKLNQGRQELGDALLANPRNAAAGSLRQLDPEIARARNLSLFVYDIDFFSPDQSEIKEPKTQYEELSLLKKLGFPVNEYARQCASASLVQKYFEEWKEPHNELPYGVDGIVIKLDEVALQKIAGYTAKSPRYGVAYKFPAVETTTVVEAIEIQVGRTGVITPVAHLKPVLIDGSTVARATLHNEDQIKRLDIRVGDTIILRKAGDVIPEVVAVIESLRPSQSTPYKFPKKVGACGGDGAIERIPGTAAYRCVSLDSDFLHRQKLYYFVSKTALNIDGVGPRIIDELVDKKLIKNAADLFNLTKADFLNLPGFKEKSASNAVTAIVVASKVTFSRLLVGLSIEHVGEETARLLASHYKTPEQLRQASKEELQAVYGIGEVVAEALVKWQENKAEQDLLKRLLFHIELTPELGVIGSGPLFGKSLIFTGTLDGISRSEAEELVLIAGGNIVSSVSSKTSYVVIGGSPGSKVAQAKKLGVKIITQTEFMALIAG